MDGLDARLRRALAGVSVAPLPPTAPPGEPSSPRGTLEGFGAALARAGGELVRVSDEDGARRWIEERAGARPVAWAEEAYDETRLRAAALGVDRADLLLAETGTVVRTYPSREAARVSLVPPTVVFLARPGDLVAHLAEALERVATHHRQGRATTVFVTGPSRTADIEKQLVIPAHGPRELIVVLAEVA